MRNWVGVGGCAAAVLMSANSLSAQERAEPPKPATSSEATAPRIAPPTVSVTRHTGTFGGQRVSYTATASETYLKAEDGTPRAAIFSTSYVREPRDPSRPVTFLFNGGPGSGSVWLHMGAFGPKRVGVPSDARDDGGPPIPLWTIPTPCWT